MLKSFLAEFISEKLNFKVKHSDLKIICKHSSIKDHELIKDKEFLNENEILIIIFNEEFTLRHEESKKLENLISEDLSIIPKINLNDAGSIIIDNVESENNLCRIAEISEVEMIVNPNFCPILTKKNYVTEPDFFKISKMSKKELQIIEKFSIANEFGKIEFPGFSDLTFLNLDDIINIDFKFISVYQNCEIPIIGQKLNREAILYFYQFFIDEDYSQNHGEFEKYMEMLEENCRKSNVEYFVKF